ncbi:hypothetical protein B0H14DRAFT_2606443 [Mycena olivaceomarginata]|nr:hypothetical protein B0H14DRAFT_2606443 [Mycena olivaceomarginata]
MFIGSLRLHLENQEIVKGRWDATDVTKALEQWDQNQQQAQSTSEQSTSEQSETKLFSANTLDLDEVFWRLFNWMPRFLVTITGHRVPLPIPTKTKADCFNCSETTHVLSACPHPLDKPLIALSRQIYEFERADDGAPRSLREVAERLARADWAGASGGGFVPGKVSPALRRALRWRDWWDDSRWSGEEVEVEQDAGEDDGQGYDYLGNIALWGYPRGWVRGVDPRERMRARIMHERDPVDSEEEEEVMKIWGEEGEEEILLSEAGRHEERPKAGEETDADNTTDGSEEGELHEPNGNSAPPVLTRWAHYPRHALCVGPPDGVRWHAPQPARPIHATTTSTHSPFSSARTSGSTTPSTTASASPDTCTSARPPAPTAILRACCAPASASVLAWLRRLRVRVRVRLPPSIDLRIHVRPPAQQPMAQSHNHAPSPQSIVSSRAHPLPQRPQVAHSSSHGVNVEEEEAEEERWIYRTENLRAHKKCRETNSKRIEWIQEKIWSPSKRSASLGSRKAISNPWSHIFWIAATMLDGQASPAR